MMYFKARADKSHNACCLQSGLALFAWVNLNVLKKRKDEGQV